MSFTCKLKEFFIEAEGKPSMARLLCFLAYFPASYVLIKAGTAEALGLYLGAFVINSLGGKHFGRKEKAQDSAQGTTKEVKKAQKG